MMNSKPQIRVATIVLAVASFLSACSTTNSGFSKPDFSKVSVGMTKAETLVALGKPDTTATQGRQEYLEYGWDDPWDGRIAPAEWYYVRLLDGRVESFGRKGDFNSTKNPTVDVNINQSVTTKKGAETDPAPSSDLFTRLKKLQTLKDEGLLTDDEFQQLKRKAIEEAK